MPLPAVVHVHLLTPTFLPCLLASTCLCAPTSACPCTSTSACTCLPLYTCPYAPLCLPLLAYTWSGTVPPCLWDCNLHTPGPACSHHLPAPAHPPMPTYACLCAYAHLSLWPPMPTSFSTLSSDALAYNNIALLYSEESAIAGLLDAGAMNSTMGDWGQWAKVGGG
ncbi:hypothetical protein BJV74DRAFT_794573 [Russula compacta]|nr:hypothetical protein BJV74DRAFT_794573 [Russula compacta]